MGERTRNFVRSILSHGRAFSRKIPTLRPCHFWGEGRAREFPNDPCGKGLKHVKIDKWIEMMQQLHKGRTRLDRKFRTFKSHSWTISLSIRNWWGTSKFRTQNVIRNKRDFLISNLKKKESNWKYWQSTYSGNYYEISQRKRWSGTPVRVVDKKSKVVLVGEN